MAYFVLTLMQDIALILLIAVSAHSMAIVYLDAVSLVALIALSAVWSSSANKWSAFAIYTLPI